MPAEVLGEDADPGLVVDVTGNEQADGARLDVGMRGAEPCGRTSDGLDDQIGRCGRRPAGCGCAPAPRIVPAAVDQRGLHVGAADVEGEHGAAGTEVNGAGAAGALPVRPGEGGAAGDSAFTRPG